MEESGKMDTAAMAVKCRTQIASVRSTAPPIVASVEGLRRTTSRASAPRNTPPIRDTATRSWFQTMRPCTSKAAMPV